MSNRIETLLHIKGAKKNMRKTMTKEVTKTTVKLAKMVVGENGMPTAEVLPDVILIDNVSLEKAQKAVAKLYEFPVTVFGVQAETQVYQMPVEEFIKLATLVTKEEAAEVEKQEAAEEATA